MLPVPLPCFYRTGVLAPGLLESLEFGLSTLQVHGSIDLPELGRVGLVILGWDVLDGVADQMDDAALHDHLGEDGLCSLFQTGDTIHADESDIFNATGLQLIEYLHPVMFALRLVHPKAQDILRAIDVIAEDDVDSVVLGLIILAYRDVQAVYEQEGVEGVQRTCLPMLDFVHHSVCDVRDALCGQLESIDVINRLGNIPLAHAACIHGQYLALDPCDILGAFGDYLGLEGRFAVPWDADGDLADRSLDGFLRIAIPTVGGFLLAMIIGAIPEMVIYLALQHSFEDRTEHVLQRYLHVFLRLRLVLFHDELGDCLAFLTRVSTFLHQCCTQFLSTCFLIVYRTSTKK